MAEVSTVLTKSRFTNGTEVFLVFLYGSIYHVEFSNN
jgi:hypothetical protein